MNRKVVPLLIALMFPVALVLLFQFFSRGVYEVPLLYTDEVGPIPPECPYTYEVPYLLPDSVLDIYPSVKRAPLSVFCFDGDGSLKCNRLGQIKEEFESDGVRFIDAAPDSHSYYNRLKTCVFLVRSDSAVVLVDSARRIRGYYKPAIQEEADRLVVEMKVILNKY